ncbi:MAG: helix-turn-helix transcriptional regulator [Polyangiaceae bacterium]
MTPEELKSLRAELKCSTRELALAIDVDQATILSWERGETFPTKQFVDRLEAARARGAKAIPRKAKPTAPLDPLELLGDPEIWSVIRKLLANADFRREVLALAKRF